MYENVFIGKNAQNQPKRILILGESHYEESGKIDGTASVVQTLAVEGKDTEKGTNFYKNIMKTFGYEITEESRKDFWSKVYCGNYIDELCGKGENNTASEKVKNKEKGNRIKYNDSLFSFINENEIDIVLCFSRLVYNNLPGSTKGESEKRLIEHENLYIKEFTYQPNCSHKNCNVQLNNKLTVYGLRHPSSHFSPDFYYNNYFKNHKNEIGL